MTRNDQSMAKNEVSREYGSRPPTSEERVLALFEAHSEGLTALQVALLMPFFKRGASGAIARLYEAGLLTRTGVGVRLHPYVYALGVKPPTPQPQVAFKVSAQAGAALRVVRQLARPSAAALAAQHGCSYVTGRKLWAELVECGAVSA